MLRFGSAHYNAIAVSIPKHCAALYLICTTINVFCVPQSIWRQCTHYTIQAHEKCCLYVSLNRQGTGCG